jgi:crotonobetainyl-CoA:carnitine CoA-transferase CaiB-like acyl-CoA transferase
MSTSAAATDESLPLSGIKVLDFSQIMLGPCCTQVLGDYGADVIKIERPTTGDLSRTCIHDPAGLDNPVFQALNRNKRSIAIDTRTEAGKELVYRLVRDADVVVNNFRPGVMERMGFGYAKLAEINPGIIWGFGSGFGSSGPYQHKGGQDVLAQAYSGLMARKASPHHPTAIYPTALNDFAAGMHLVQGILLALIERSRTGLGQKVEVSLYDSALAMQMQEAAVQGMRSYDLNWATLPLNGVFSTTDGEIVLIGAFKENPLRDICRALEIEDLSADPRYADLGAQIQEREFLQKVLRESFATNTTEHWMTRLEDQDLLCGPVKTLTEALADPQTEHNGILLEFLSTQGETVRTVGSPITMSRSTTSVRRVPPTLGQDRDDVLRELGVSEEEIADLLGQKVVR